MLFSYFLLISKLQRDTPGTGWLDYDRAFRKKAAEDQSISWYTVDITLFVTTVLAKSSSLISPATSKIVPAERGDKPCLNWNFKSCKFDANCKLCHECFNCKCSHKHGECDNPAKSPATIQAVSSHSTPSSPPRKRRDRK